MRTFSKYDGIDIDVLEWANSMSVKPTTKYLFHLSNLVKKLKSNNIWYNLDRFWIFATEQQEHARKDLIYNSLLTEVSSPTWNAGFGYTGNGTSSYLNLGFAMNTLTKRTQNNGFYAYYKRTNAGSTAFDLGYNNASSQGDVCRPNTSAVKAFSCNSVQGANTASVGSNGLIAVQRNNSTQFTYHQKGIYYETRSQTSIALPALNFYVMCRNNNGAAANFSNQQFSMFVIGKGIDQIKFYEIFQEFATAIGFNV